ncbi:MAG: sigma-54-dependent Fis family transcriptional regulator [Prolixibacteraceae bacterium]|nr:sigma-54-dependent Fis family transcriptional regulator [Prolixibacteraceae bacterium]MBN2773860.1 sigma-54-dependent Fis family transcriptional regulator [Prolixibacteraceae bacterium]
MPGKKNILAVDDSANMLELIRRILTPKGYSVYTVSGVAQAIKLLQEIDIDLVITDIRMPEIEGTELVRFVNENYRNTVVLVITGYPTIETAVETVKLGACEYLTKLFTEQELLEAVQSSLQKLRNREIGNARFEGLPLLQTGLIGGSPGMLKIYREIDKASKIKATVMITGETGTGKELVARAIHYNSSQASAPFVPVNCGAIPDELMESEMFGYKKGAFTGAYESRGGFFQAADGGTIFLDEITNTTPPMQAKLLRVLQEKEVYMIGCNKSQKIDTRIIASSNSDPEVLIKKGIFREDLYYRLNVIPIHILPLRERGDDILLLANHFAHKYSEETIKSTPEFSDEVIDIFLNYYWPGNVRELENLVHRLVIMTDEPVIKTPDLPKILRYSVNPQKKTFGSLADAEKEYIEQVLAFVKGNKTKAAEILKIDRKTLREKLK